MESGVLDTCETALNQFEAMGATVEKLDPPFAADQIWNAWVKLRAWANAGGKAALYENPKTRALLKEDAIWEIETGLSLTAMEVHQMSVIRSQWFTKLNTLFSDYDALVLPSAQVWPFPADWTSPIDVDGRVMDTYHRWMEVVIPVSLVGVPCVNVPAGFGPTDLPMGLQIFGPRHSDAKFLRIAQRWHDTIDFHQRRPDIVLLSGA